MTDFTKREIKNKFMELLTEYNFDKITVKELVDACGISRNTFYYHYHDIFEVMEDICENEILKMNESHEHFNSLKDAFTSATAFAQKNKKAVLHLRQSSKTVYFENYLLRMFEKAITEYIRQQAEDLDVEEKDINMLVVFYKYGLVGILKEWFDSGMQGDESGLIDRMVYILEGNIRASLRKISATQQ